MSSSHLRPGDKVWVQGRLGTHHYGIYAGNGHFIHASKDRGMVVVEDEQVFADGYEIHVESRAKPGFEWEVVARAREYLGKRYDLFLFNCEHLASLAHEGTASSPQLAGGLIAAGAMLLVALAPTIPTGVRLVTGYDLNVGRWRDRRGRFTA